MRRREGFPFLLAVALIMLFLARRQKITIFIDLFHFLLEFLHVSVYSFLNEILLQ